MEANEELGRQIADDILNHGMAYIMITANGSLRLDPRWVVIQRFPSTGYEGLVNAVQAAQLHAAAGALDTPSTMQLPSNPRGGDGVKSETLPEPLHVADPDALVAWLDTPEGQAELKKPRPQVMYGSDLIFGVRGMPNGVPSSRAHAFGRCQHLQIVTDTDTGHLRCESCGELLAKLLTASDIEILKSNEDLLP